MPPAQSFALNQWLAAALLDLILRKITRLN
jgi:hypothetical protein